MLLRKAMRIILASGLASGLAFGEGMSGILETAPAPSRYADLDFTDDFPAPVPAPGKVPRGKRAGKGRSAPVTPAAPPEPEASSAWIYWTLGTLGLSAVAGGAVWYLHNEKAPAPVRNVQVFTDDP